MKRKNIALLIPICIISLFLNGCSKNTNIKEEDKVNSLLLPRYVIGEVVNNTTNLYDLDNGIGNKIGQIENLIDLRFNYKTQTSAKIIYLENGENLIKNKIVINYKNKEEELDGFYSAMDLKIAPQGDKIAYRYYKQDSLDSIENMVVYDINEKKFIKLNTDTIISGDLYDFISDDEVIYYGVNMNTKDRGIFKYSLTKNKEELVYKLTNGNITSLKCLDDNKLILISSDNIESSLGTIDLKTLELKKIKNNFEELYSVNMLNDRVYIMAKEKDKNVAIYLFDKSLKRITYSLPQNINSKFPIINDDKGNIYFVGYDEKESKSDIYMIKEDNSVNIVSNTSKLYKLFK